MKGLFNWLNKTKVFRDLSPQEFSWVLYDVGNSAYTMLACSLIPIWFKDLAIGTNPGQITGDQATAYYSIAISISNDQLRKYKTHDEIIKALATLDYVYHIEEITL